MLCILIGSKPAAPSARLDGGGLLDDAQYRLAQGLVTFGTRGVVESRIEYVDAAGQPIRLIVRSRSHLSCKHGGCRVKDFDAGGCVRMRKACRHITFRTCQKSCT